MKIADLRPRLIDQHYVWKFGDRRYGFSAAMLHDGSADEGSVELNWRIGGTGQYNTAALQRSVDWEFASAEIDLEYRFNSKISIWSEFLLRDESSSDPRLNYARNRAIVGIKWRH